MCSLNSTAIGGCSDAFQRVVLVTGATGFTGGHVALELKKRGYHVKALARDLDKAQRLCQAGIEVVEGDLTNERDVIRAVEGCESVYHIAALYRSAGESDEMFRAVNVHGTRHILDAARACKVKRVVHCSTVGVHGEIKKIPEDEDAPFNPGDIYQATKLEGELLAQHAIIARLPVTIVRPVGIYGPGDTRFLKLFKTIRTGHFRMIGSGQVQYHLTHIDDVVKGFILCGEKPNAIGQTYIIAGPRYTTVMELALLVADAVNCELSTRHVPIWPVKAAATICQTVCKPLRIDPPLHNRRLDFFLKDRAFSSRKAEQQLGYSPQIDLAAGLRQTAQWYFDHGYLS